MAVLSQALLRLHCLTKELYIECSKNQKWSKFYKFILEHQNLEIILTEIGNNFENILLIALEDLNKTNIYDEKDTILKTIFIIFKFKPIHIEEQNSVKIMDFLLLSLREKNLPYLYMNNIFELLQLQNFYETNITLHIKDIIVDIQRILMDSKKYMTQEQTTQTSLNVLDLINKFIIQTPMSMSKNSTQWLRILYGMLFHQSTYIRQQSLAILQNTLHITPIDKYEYSMDIYNICLSPNKDVVIKDLKEYIMPKLEKTMDQDMLFSLMIIDVFIKILDRDMVSSFTIIKRFQRILKRSFFHKDHSLLHQFYITWGHFVETLRHNINFINEINMIGFIFKPFSYHKQFNDYSFELKTTVSHTLITIFNSVHLNSLFQKLDQLWDKEAMYHFLQNVFYFMDEFINYSLVGNDFTVLNHVCKALSSWLTIKISTFNMYHITVMSTTFCNSIISFCEPCGKLTLLETEPRILNALHSFWRIWIKYPVLKVHTQALLTWNQSFGQCRTLVYPLDSNFKDTMLKEACLHVKMPDEAIKEDLSMITSPTSDYNLSHNKLCNDDEAYQGDLESNDSSSTKLSPRSKHFKHKMHSGSYYTGVSTTSTPPQSTTGNESISNSKGLSDIPEDPDVPMLDISLNENGILNPNTSVTPITGILKKRSKYEEGRGQNYTFPTLGRKQNYDKLSSPLPYRLLSLGRAFQIKRGSEFSLDHSETGYHSADNGIKSPQIKKRIRFANDEPIGSDKKIASSKKSGNADDKICVNLCNKSRKDGMAQVCEEFDLDRLTKSQTYDHDPKINQPANMESTREEDGLVSLEWGKTVEQNDVLKMCNVEKMGVESIKVKGKCSDVEYLELFNNMPQTLNQKYIKDDTDIVIPPNDKDKIASNEQQPKLFPLRDCSVNMEELSLEDISAELIKEDGHENSLVGITTQISASQPIFPLLSDNRDPIVSLIPYISFTGLSKGLEKALLVRNVSTIGQFCDLTEFDIHHLPIPSPKISRCKKILTKILQKTEQKRILL